MVCYVLEWNVLVLCDVIVVMVEDGYIIFFGDVEWVYVCIVVEFSVCGLLGVKGVSNLICICL